MPGPKCKEPECNKRAKYGLINLGNNYCKVHRKDNMIDNTIKKCIECGQSHVNKREYLCSTCFRNKFPNHPINKKIKQKEIYIVNKIKQDYPALQLQFDKTIFLDCFNYTIIIEIDENQHCSYSCDNKRLMEIFESLGNRPLICIRFNPDKYKNFSSIFTFTKSGFVLETKQFLDRYTKLKECFDFHLNNIPTKEITIEHLYFDN
jgi:hypothetical protein